jgi:hypothetical protein
MVQQAKVPTKNFKDLIGAVLKFPPSASIAASEVIHFAVNKGRARASISGVVVSTAAVIGMRELDAFTADYRSFRAYASILPDDATLDLEMSVKDNQVRLVCGELKLTLALTLGAVVPRPKVPEPFFIATKETVTALKWLASIAEKDESKPDMCCVYLKHGVAMSGNQKCIGVSRVAGLPDVELPLPLHLCSVLEPGDRLSKTDGGLLLASGCGISQIPFLAPSINFPVAVVERLESMKGDVYGHCQASVMVDVFGESADCVARVPKAQAFIVLSFKDGKIQVKAQSQTASFRTVMAGSVEKDGDLWLELPEAEEALSVFGVGDVLCRKLAGKGETALESAETKIFFAPVKVA